MSQVDENYEESRVCLVTESYDKCRKYIAYTYIIVFHFLVSARNNKGGDMLKAGAIYFSRRLFIVSKSEKDLI